MDINSLNFAREYRSLISEGWIYVGKVNSIYCFRHPNGNRATLVYNQEKTSLYVNGQYRKDL